MENVVLVIHLILALCLIAVVLLQRSEGGALGIGGGGGGGVSQRSALSPLAKVTWVLAVAFITTSLTLTILAGGRTDESSIFDATVPGGDGDIPLPGPSGGSLEGDGPLIPPADSDGAPIAPPTAD
jgi:preprotein translocase subunit SecG